MLAITFGNRTINGQILLVYGQNLVCAVTMSGHTRDREEPSCSSTWVVENDRELNTSVWLKFDGDRNHVFSLKCAVCSEFKDMLISMQNYRPAFIEGTTNI